MRKTIPRSKEDKEFFARSERRELYLMLPFGLDESERHVTIHNGPYVSLWKDELHRDTDEDQVHFLMGFTDYVINSVLYLELSRDYNPNHPENFEPMFEDWRKSELYQFMIREPESGVDNYYHPKEYTVEAIRRIYHKLKRRLRKKYNHMSFNRRNNGIALNRWQKKLVYRFDLLFYENGNLKGTGIPRRDQSEEDKEIVYMFMGEALEEYRWNKTTMEMNDPLLVDDDEDDEDDEDNSKSLLSDNKPYYDNVIDLAAWKGRKQLLN